MNKTVTINISGIIFHIEEDAYDSLSRYLSTIKGYFSNTDGGNEIMVDIEARIAELLQEKISLSKQVILMADVEHVKNVMGKPEEFGAEPAAGQPNEQQEEFEYSGEKIKRRLFRNPDEKAIGGVCSGLAAYFNIDTVWVRLAMFLLVFFGGLSLWVYIILWIVIPEARTTAEKFAMRGESANINKIYQSFKDEAEDVKNRFNRNKGAYKQQVYTAGNNVRRGGTEVLNTLFNIFGRLVGLFLLFVGGILLLAYVGSLLGISIADSNTDVAQWKAVIFASSSDYALAVLSFIIVLGIPVFMLLYAGIKLLFKIRYSNRWLNLSLGLIWIVGFAIGVYATIVTLKQFNESSRLKETAELHGTGDTIVIKMSSAIAALGTMQVDNTDDLENYFSRNHSGYCFAESGRQLGIIGYADLNVVESSSDSVELVINREARGGNKRDANENAREIKYAYRRVGNEIIFDEIFSVTQGAKFRAQEVNIKLKLPKGKVIFFDKSVKYLLNDVDNTTNTWDGDMIGRRWIMTEKGLKCIDCDNLDNIDDHHNNEDEIRTKNITINDDGIKVNGKDAEIKIDNDGIRIKTPDKEYEIKSDEKEKNVDRKKNNRKEEENDEKY